MTRAKILLVLAAMILVGLCIPLPQIVAPDWTVATLNSDRKPLADIIVREVWQQYSVEGTSHEEDRLTDNNGEVHFPRRSQRVSIAARLFGCARQIVVTGVHAGCGPHSYLVAFGSGVDTTDWADSEQENGMTIPRRRSTLILKH
jgi:hypothetical protein